MKEKTEISHQLPACTDHQCPSSLSAVSLHVFDKMELATVDVF